MLRKIKNNTIHIIPLKSGIIPSFGEKEVEITKDELKHFNDKISVIGESSIDKFDKQQDKIKEEIKQDDILNKHTINDYLQRSTRTVLNSIDEDKSGLTKNDYDLMSDYEKSHKNRDRVLQKIKELRGE